MFKNSFSLSLSLSESVRSRGFCNSGCNRGVLGCGRGRFPCCFYHVVTRLRVHPISWVPRQSDAWHFTRAVSACTRAPALVCALSLRALPFLRM